LDKVIIEGQAQLGADYDCYDLEDLTYVVVMLMGIITRYDIVSSLDVVMPDVNNEFDDGLVIVYFLFDLWLYYDSTVAPRPVYRGRV
jgi:hypothetical protein